MLKLIVYPLLVLFVLYCVGIQYERKSLPRPLYYLCISVAAVGLALDVVLNFTTLALLTLDLPRRNVHGNFEWTFSTRLERLTRVDNWRHRPALIIKLVLDYIAPSGLHIR